MDPKLAYQLLEWDTHFFGFSVAKIHPKRLIKQDLIEILKEMKSSGVKLAYWQSAKKIPGSLSKELDAEYVNRKVTFEIDFQKLNPQKFISIDSVEPYTPSMSIVELETLAIQSGEYSRFSVDRNVTREKFEELYRKWIRKSLTKEIAEEVLVIQEDDSVVGMITLGENKGEGEIGLVAVDSNYRGRKFGEMLVRAAQVWFIGAGYKSGQVVTQKENVPACNLYKKCGYSVAEVLYTYHFWL